MPQNISPKDRTILRDVAKQIAEIADTPEMDEKREMWKKHNALERVRPMILVFPEGSWREIAPTIECQCEGDGARKTERWLRSRLYEYEQHHDDKPVDKTWIISKAIHSTGWGLEPKWKPSDDPTGARTFDPVILKPADLKKLTIPRISHDEEASMQNLADAEELLGGILDIRLRGVSCVSFHLMSEYTALRGLEEVMMDMVVAPGMLHDAMSFFEEAHRSIVQQWIDLNLLSLNNDGTYHSSGGVSYTDELPAKGFDPERVRPCDIWASAEAQELAQVSPEMHEEFSLQYERRLLEPFGLNGYGCCEDLTKKLDDVLTIPNIRRISIAPWADVDKCAEKLGNKAVFSWKPHPAHLASEEFDAGMVRDYIEHTLDVTKGCVVEMILKDTHTCRNHPERFTMWTDIARDLAEQY
jgi:hypothetical protein